MTLDEMFKEIRSGAAGRERVTSMLYNDMRLQNGIRSVMQIGKANDDDFNDIFDYTLVQFLKGVMEKPDFKITTNLNSYLFGTARNLWLQELKKRKRLPESMPEDFNAVDQAPTADLLIMIEEKNKILQDVLKKLGVKCREVLMLWAAGYKMKEIANQLKYKSEGAARKKKHNCWKELNSYFEDNPNAKKILKE